MLTLRTLGPPRLDGPDGEVLRGRRKELALLAYLARRRPRAVPREALADLLWGSRPDANARQSLRQALLSLKRAVPGGFDAEADAVSLGADALELDVAQFEEALGTGRSAEALARWHGDFLDGFDDVGGEAFRTWVEGERAALRKRLEVALTELVDDAERRGDRVAAIRWATRWTDLLPLDERGAVRLVEALQHAGRGADALAHQSAFAARLRDLGVEPSSEFSRLSEALGTPSGAVTPTPVSGVLFTPDLVGRAAAVEALRRAWTLATSGTTTLVLVEGHEGMGKTRLCEEFERGLPAGTVVFRTRGIEAGRDVPYSAMHEMLAGLHEAPGLSGARATALATVGVLAPGVRERFPDAAPAGRGSALAEALADVLAAVAAERPVLLLMDDFPAADRESQALLLAVARRLRHAALCVVVTARTGDAPEDLLAELRGRVGETRIRLTPLAERDVESLIASMLEVAPDARSALAHRLYAESGGNPYYLIETMAALLDEGRLTADVRGVWRPTLDVLDGSLPIPPSVRDAARRRFAALSPEGRVVAEAAAVLGALTTRDRLTFMTRQATERVESALEELVLRRVLRPSPVGDGTFDFAHDVTRRAVLEQLSGTRRRRLHGAALRALGADPPPSELAGAAVAHHRRHAGPLGGRLPPWMGTRALVTAAAVALAAVAAWLVLAPSTTGFTERDWIVLADLDNATGDSVFDESLTAALFVSLSQSQHVNVYPPARIQETLQRMQRGGARPLTEQLAREVAQREGIRAVVTLSLTRSEDRYTLTCRIVDPATGDSRATLTAEAGGRDHVLSALDVLAADLRKRLGESAQQIRERSVPLPQATTASLEALKAFAEGMRAQDEGRTGDALTAWRAAVALDSGFASAYAALGWYLVWMNIAVDATPYLERAQALADRLPPRERLEVEWTVARGRGDRTTAIRLAREYLRQYPDDRDAWFGLARSLQEAGDHEAALEAYRRELEIDPNAAAALENSALLYGLEGRPREAVAAFERAMALDSTLLTRIAGDRNRLFGFALLSLGDSARARATFTLLLVGDRAQRANGLRSLALLEAYFGRYRRAADWLTQAITINREDDARVSELRNRLHLAAVYRTAGNAAAAREQLRRAVTIQESLPALPMTWLAFLGQQLARSGMLAEADRIASVIEGHRQLRSPRDSAWLALARGETALARGDAATAASLLANIAPAEDRNYFRQGLARALVAAGRDDDARTTYQTMLRDSALGDEAQEPWVLAHYELAQLFDADGDSAAALPLYRRLAEQWRFGDPDLPPLQRIRQRLNPAR